ncbi:hypothetical protein ABIC65_001080 [Sphingomonas trueperi]
MSDSIIQIAREMEPGDIVYQRAVAQGKVALRKRWLSEIADVPGEFRVRYAGQGVRMERVA